MKIIIDSENLYNIETDTQVRKGDCKGCGRCCYDIYGVKCEYLFIGSYADHERTIPIYSCKLQEKKPYTCALYPLSNEKIREGCGFHWENK